MQIIKETFTDFDLYNQTIKDWHLEYNILSNKDFMATLNMFSDDLFAISRISLQGKLVHNGFAPDGFRSFIIPINYGNKFLFFNKGYDGKELLIFPKNNELNAVTFNNFDAFVISIENNFLKSKLEKIDFFKCEEIFGENEVSLFLTKEFASEFYSLANYFIDKHINSADFSDNNTYEHKELVNTIIDKLLKFIEHTHLIKNIHIKNKKERALTEAISIIHNNTESVISIKELSLLTNVSERTLLYAFKEKYNISPSQYIKSYRLNRVKTELFASKEKPISISAIAGKYHFWHMGQFAKDFKKQFGMLPSDLYK